MLWLRKCSYLILKSDVIFDQWHGPRKHKVPTLNRLWVQFILIFTVCCVGVYFVGREREKLVVSSTVSSDQLTITFKYIKTTQLWAVVYTHTIVWTVIELRLRRQRSENDILRSLRSNLQSSFVRSCVSLDMLFWSLLSTQPLVNSIFVCLDSYSQQAM